VKNESFDAAIERLRAYHSAGADVLMLMPEDERQIRAARDALPGPLATIAPMDRASSQPWSSSGWNLLIDPFTAQVLAVQAVQQAYQRFLSEGSTGADLKSLLATYGTLDEMAGLGPLYDIEARTTEAD
jgi:2-methylisocitrate lyase-like PEP mutase family enzyme